MNGRRIAAGFTMIEILIVILIFAVLAGLAASSMGRGIRQSKMNSAAAQAATALKRARSLAITRGHIHCAVIGSDTITIWEITDEALGVPIDLVALDGLDTPGKKDQAGGAQIETGTVMSAGQDFIAFLPDGSAWGPGMQAPEEITLRFDNASTPLDERTLVVGALSGGVTIDN